MKKYSVLLALIMLSGFAMGQSLRMVLVEEFTQASCAPCASQNPDFNALLNANASKVIPLKYQTPWPGIDPMNAQNQSQVATRVMYYEVSGVPEMVMDGDALQTSPSDFTQQDIDNQAAVPSPFDIALSHWFNAAGDSVFVHCLVTATQGISMGSPRLRVAMVEEVISFTSPPGSNGEMVFEQVMRKMYPSVLGFELENAWAIGGSQTITFGAAVPGYIYDRSEIAMVAWIQDDADRHIHQAAESNAPTAPILAAPVAAFSADVEATCSGLVHFRDESLHFPTTFHWDFGDGQTSNLPNPSHLYLVDSTFSVTLTVGNALGADTLLKARFIDAEHVGPAPIGTDAYGCTGDTVSLSAVAQQGGTVIWQDDSGNVVGQGSPFVTAISGTREYYASETTPAAILSLGIPNTIPGGSQYYNGSTMHGLFFDVTSPCRLLSVDVDAGSAGPRLFLVYDSNGDLVNSRTLNVMPGYHTVNLGFDLEVGSQYLIKLGGPNLDLFRDVGGSLYPYQSPVLNITGCTSSVEPDNYYFFYNWKVLPRACQSLGTVVTVVDTCAVTVLDPEAAVGDLRVAPNPSSGRITVSFESLRMGDVAVTVHNAMGQVVYEEKMPQFQGDYQRAIDLAGTGSGIYFLTVSGRRGHATRRIAIY